MTPDILTEANRLAGTIERLEREQQAIERTQALIRELGVGAVEVSMQVGPVGSSHVRIAARAAARDRRPDIEVSDGVIEQILAGARVENAARLVDARAALEAL